MRKAMAFMFTDTDETADRLEMTGKLFRNKR